MYFSFNDLKIALVSAIVEQNHTTNIKETMNSKNFKNLVKDWIWKNIPSYSGYQPKFLTIIFTLDILDFKWMRRQSRSFSVVLVVKTVTKFGQSHILSILFVGGLGGWMLNLSTE